MINFHMMISGSRWRVELCFASKFNFLTLVTSKLGFHHRFMEQLRPNSIGKINRRASAIAHLVFKHLLTGEQIPYITCIIAG